MARSAGGLGGVLDDVLAPAPQDRYDAPAGSAVAALERLPVKGKAPKTGYSREQFGQAWRDVDANGCDTRDDVLARDLTDVVFSRTDPCQVSSGVLVDPYTPKEIRFQRGPRSAEVQIDHVVALSDAWQTGAQQWTPQQREQFANDPLNLLAVDGPLNAAKGDGDAATWLPPNKGFRCQYVARQIAVKAEYGAWVTQAEHDAMADVLATCPRQPLPRDDGGVGPGDAQTGTAPGGTASTAPYASCSAAREAGAGPLRSGDPGWNPRLDRDGDGVACA
ncbi:GmrSD restriction endonuclease domain-containing protein [Quadrisphaera sp. KR29]|uniref:GmrSD restriction endonuclease domain-containing protein n=1 Tax=Quadrisphaera sp. KR29 TaxID=3461391 RepID=UPI004043CCBC